MAYPSSPFKKDFNTKLIFQLPDDSTNDKVVQINQNDEEHKELFRWLCIAPKISSYRVNTLKTSLSEVEDIIQKDLNKNPHLKNNPVLQKCEFSNEVLIIHNLPTEENNCFKYEKEVIVDTDCAAAVLRGAHIFAPGVLGMMSGIKKNDNVSIYCDVQKKCKKGFRAVFEDDDKIHIGNGRVKLERHELFGKHIIMFGVAVEVFETISGSIYFNYEILPCGFVLLQNLPSILCSIILNPQPEDIVLDMCASPGNKTTHLAALMKNTGIIIAIDKTPVKVCVLKQKCEDFDTSNVICFQADSTKIFDKNSKCDLSNSKLISPPFSAECFDKILLDAPCSVLGKRPQFINTVTEKELKSYVPLQRKLFETAINLLKPGGMLVYSTCTITLAENEGIVAWALRKFSNLRLIQPKICLGSPGWKGTTLTEEERFCVQRFGPNTKNIDSVGFFVACFNKIYI